MKKEIYAVLMLSHEEIVGAIATVVDNVTHFKSSTGSYNTAEYDSHEDAVNDLIPLIAYNYRGQPVEVVPLRELADWYAMETAE